MGLSNLVRCFFVLTLLVTPALLAGCVGGSDAMTTHPTVFVDESFDAFLPDVVAGLRSWPGVVPDVVTVSREDVLALARTAEPNTVYLVRSSTVDQVGCPWAGHDSNLGGEAAVTHPLAGLTCVAADYVAQHPALDGGESAMRRAVAHEFGHELGLRFDNAADPHHYPGGGRLMSADYYGPDAPAEEDLAALRARFPELAR